VWSVNSGVICKKHKNHKKSVRILTITSHSKLHTAIKNFMEVKNDE
jgi:hypothetical protein